MEIVEKFIEVNKLAWIATHLEIYKNHLNAFQAFCKEENETLVFDSIKEEFIEGAASIVYKYEGEERFTHEDNTDILVLHDDEWYHEDSLCYYDIVFVDADDCFAHISQCISGIINSRGHEGLFLKREHNYIQFNGMYYISEDVANDNGIYFCCDHDEWYDSNVEGCQECNEDGNNGDLFEYHSDHREDFTNEETHFRVGFEVEKEDEDLQKEECAIELFENTGWAKEKDGSLDDDSGFELVSPTYDLFSDKIIESFNKVTKYLNAGFSGNCGGHINYSIRGMEPIEMLKTVEGYLPLLYCMYQHRLHNRFCAAKKAELLYSDGDKYQAVALKDNRIEFRIFSAVKSQKHLEWRLELMKIFANHPRTQVHEVLRDLCCKGSDLHKHLLKIFTLDQLQEKINLFIKYSLEIEEINLKNMINDSYTFNENEKPILPPPMHVFKIGDVVSIKSGETLTVGGVEYPDSLGIIINMDRTHATLCFGSVLESFGFKDKGDRHTLTLRKKDLIFMEEFGNKVDLGSINYNNYMANRSLNELGFSIGQIVEVHSFCDGAEEAVIGSHVRIIEYMNRPPHRLNVIVQNLDGSDFANHSSHYYMSTNQIRPISIPFEGFQVGSMVIRNLTEF